MMSLRGRSLQQRWRGWLPALVLLLALGPLVGVSHRVWHGQGSALLAVASASAAVSPDDTNAAADAFGHGANTADCQLFDQALCGAGPAHTPWALPATPPVASAPNAAQPDRPALAPAWRRSARGPPSAAWV